VFVGRVRLGVWGVVLVVCVCRCRECCSLSVCVCVCVCVCDLLIFLTTSRGAVCEYRRRVRSFPSLFGRSNNGGGQLGGPGKDATAADSLSAL